jgi:hypothetical protein
MEEWRGREAAASKRWRTLTLEVERDWRECEQGAVRQICPCLNYLAHSLPWFHRLLDFFQKCCFPKGMWSKAGLLENRTGESSAPGRSLGAEWREVRNVCI